MCARICDKEHNYSQNQYSTSNRALLQLYKYRIKMYTYTYILLFHHKTPQNQKSVAITCLISMKQVFTKKKTAKTIFFFTTTKDNNRIGRYSKALLIIHSLNISHEVMLNIIPNTVFSSLDIKICYYKIGNL